MFVLRGSLLAVSAFSLSALALAPRLASADTYMLYTVDHTDSTNFAAGDDAGNFAINDVMWNACGHAAPHCYLVGSVASSALHLSTTMAALGKGAAVGPGDPVNVNLGGNWGEVSQLGGIFAGTYESGSTQIRGIFDGLNPYTDLLSYGSIDGGFLSAGGTAYFIDGLDNTLVVAVATPEPTTLTLLGTGLTGIAALISRRRRVSR